MPLLVILSTPFPPAPTVRVLVPDIPASAPSTDRLPSESKVSVELNPIFLPVSVITDAVVEVKVTALVIVFKSVNRVIVPEGAVKSIVFDPPAAFESIIACLSEPAPLLLVLVTVYVAASAAAEKKVAVNKTVIKLMYLLEII